MSDEPQAQMALRSFGFRDPSGVRVQHDTLGFEGFALLVTSAQGHWSDYYAPTRR
jgi:hypothetical protein